MENIETEIQELIRSAARNKWKDRLLASVIAALIAVVSITAWRVLDLLVTTPLEARANAHRQDQGWPSASAYKSPDKVLRAFPATE